MQTAPPAKKRRRAPLGVKLIGVLLFFGFGFLGCYLVYGAFLWMHSDQFHLKQYFPKFLQNRIAEEPAAAPRQHKALERPTPGSLPVATPPARHSGQSSGDANRSRRCAESHRDKPWCRAASRRQFVYRDDTRQAGAEHGRARHVRQNSPSPS